MPRVLAVGIYAFICTLLAAFLTAFYSWRLLFMTFHGKSRADHHALEHAHESPWVMLAPLVVLAFGAVFAGWALDNWFIGAGWPHFWNGSIFNGPDNEVMEYLEHVPFWVDAAPAGAGVCSASALAYVMYIANPLLPIRLAHPFWRHLPFAAEQMVFRRAVRHDFRPADDTPGAAVLAGRRRDDHRRGAERAGRTDRPTGSRQVVKLQTGSLAVYAFAMLIGVVVLIGVFMLSR